MSVALQMVLALGSWLLAAIAPAARLGYEDRRLPEGKRRGLSIFPGWPLMPLLCLTPALFLGSQHLVMKIIAGFHSVLLLWAVGYIGYWTARARRDA